MKVFIYDGKGNALFLRRGRSSALCTSNMTIPRISFAAEKLKSDFFVPQLFLNFFFVEVAGLDDRDLGAAAGEVGVVVDMAESYEELGVNDLFGNILGMSPGLAGLVTATGVLTAVGVGGDPGSAMTG